MNVAEMMPVAKQTRLDCAGRVPPEYRESILKVRIELSMRLRSAAGKASPLIRSIRLSIPIFTHPRNAERAAESLDDAVRHEIAHVLTPGDGHGRAWWLCYRHFGGRSQSRFHDLVTPKPRAGIWCPGCGSRVASCRRRDAFWVSLQTVSECCELRCRPKPPTPTQLQLFPLGSSVRYGASRASASAVRDNGRQR